MFEQIAAIILGLVVAGLMFWVLYLVNKFHKNV